MKIFYHPDQMLHHPQSYFSRGKMRSPQEKPERMTEFLKAVNALNLPLMLPEDKGFNPITNIHDLGFVQFLKTAYTQWHELPEDWGDEVMSNIFVRDNNPLIGVLAKAARYLADGSAPIGEHTWQSVYWAAQTALGCAQSLLDGEKTALGLTRPAGHHARKDAAGGFCYLNNAAISAEFLRQKFGKVAIIDTDMHHGQGVQEIFYERDDVFYVSVHANPVNFYPVVAGFENERGTGKGYGYNLNLPMEHGIDQAGFLNHVDQALDAVATFNPDVIVHILGFDVYVDDPQSKSVVYTEGFEILGQKIAALNVPKMTLVEGGYCIEKLADNLTAFINGLNHA